MNMRRPAITPAIFTVLSTCFSGSTVLEFWVEAHWSGKGKEGDIDKAHTRDYTVIIMTTAYT